MTDLPLLGDLADTRHHDIMAGSTQSNLAGDLGRRQQDASRNVVAECLNDRCRAATAYARLAKTDVRKLVQQRETPGLTQPLYDRCGQPLCTTANVIRRTKSSGSASSSLSRSERTIS